MYNDENLVEIEKKENFKRFIAGFLAGTFIGTLGTYLGMKKVEANEKKKEITSMVDDNDKLSAESNTFSATEPTELVIVDATETIEIKNDELTTEKFKQLVKDFSRAYIENNINVTETDLEKFVAIVNIDELVEDNPSLARELFAIQSKEEYLNDAAKVIGMTYMYNNNLYEKEKKTDNFINVSDAIYDEDQKAKIQMVEDYVSSIAHANGNKEEINKIVEEFLFSLSDPQSELSYLDDGVGFGMQVDIALILNSIARNDLNKENRDWLQELTSSEKYVSNIFTVYDGCNDSYGISSTYTKSNVYIRKLTR